MSKKEPIAEVPQNDELEKEVVDLMGPSPEEASGSGEFIDTSGNEAVATGAPALSDESLPIAEDKPTTNVDAEDSTEEAEEPIESQPDEPAQETQLADDALADPALDAAVKDIVASESDQLLAAEDKEKQSTATPKQQRQNPFKRWWGNKRARTITVAAVAALFLGFALYPATRYTILNSVGVRSGISITVIDSKSGVPIKNAEVFVGGAKGMTNDKGEATLTNVRLGKTQLVLNKRSFSPFSQTVIIGWGSNPYDDAFQMTPTGTAYAFTVTDWLSGNPIENVEVTDGESTAVTNAKGVGTLQVEPTDKDLKITIKGKDYRVETLTISSSDTTNKAIKLVAASPNVFVSKRSGKLDIYKRDADGKNEVILLPGTGTEQDPLGLLVSPDGSQAAVVSTRDGKRDSNGYLLSNLYMIDTQTKTVTKIPGTESAQIQLIDWVDAKLVFVKVAAGPSAATAGRQRIAVYDVKQDKQTELANANYYNDVEVYKGLVYYAPSGGSGSGEAAQLYRINLDASAKTVLLNKETWITYRTSFDKMQISATESKWYEQTLGDNKVVALGGAPASPTQRIYVSSPGSQSAWVDTRDGKGVLIVRDAKTGTEKVLVAKSGLGYPMRWLSDTHILFRVTNSVETADYVINVAGGNATKIGDVTNTAATNRWYYYR